MLLCTDGAIFLSALACEGNPEAVQGKPCSVNQLTHHAPTRFPLYNGAETNILIFEKIYKKKVAETFHVKLYKKLIQCMGEKLSKN